MEKKSFFTKETFIPIGAVGGVVVIIVSIVFWAANVSSNVSYTRTDLSEFKSSFDSRLRMVEQKQNVQDTTQAKTDTKLKSIDDNLKALKDTDIKELRDDVKKLLTAPQYREAQ